MTVHVVVGHVPGSLLLYCCYELIWEMAWYIPAQVWVQCYFMSTETMDYYSISLGTGSPGWPPWLSHRFWALSSPLALVWDLWYWCAQYEPAGAIIVWVSGYYIYMTTKKTVQSFLHCLSQQDDESSVKCGWYHMQMNGGKLVMRLEIDVGSKLPLTLFDGTYPWPGSCQSWYVLTIDLASWHQRDRDRAWETT